MKITLFMDMTLNGYIARENNETPWSKEAWDAYYALAKSYKAIVLGRKTYELMRDANELEKIGNPFTVVLTTKNSPKGKATFVQTPKEAMKILRKNGFEEALIGGGSMLNSSFMKEKMVDEIILDIEPLIFGKGVKLFSECSFESKLDLIGISKISKNLIRAHYRVK